MLSVSNSKSNKMPKSSSTRAERKIKRAAQRMKMPKTLKHLNMDDLRWQVRIMLSNHEMACDLLSESDLELQHTRQKLREMKAEFLRKSRAQALLMKRIRSELERSRERVRELRAESRAAKDLAQAMTHAQVGVTVINAENVNK